MLGLDEGLNVGGGRCQEAPLLIQLLEDVPLTEIEISGWKAPNTG